MQTYSISAILFLFVCPFINASLSSRSFSTVCIALMGSMREYDPMGEAGIRGKNFIMNWHRAILRCLARNKRYFKTLELSTEHLTISLEAEYEVAPQQAVYFSIGFFLPWLYSS